VRRTTPSPKPDTSKKGGNDLHHAHTHHHPLDVAIHPIHNGVFKANWSATSMMVEPPTAETLLLGLEAVYTKRGKQSDFAAELPTYQILIPELLAKLSAGYVLESPLNLGSTATVWAAVDKELGQKRALKLARPRFMKLQNIVEVIRAEGEKLAELNHTNIIKVYSLADVSVTEFGNNKVEYPYFLMEYFEELDDLDKFVLKHLDSLRSQELILAI
jgi:hypothetical protein